MPQFLNVLTQELVDSGFLIPRVTGGEGGEGTHFAAVSFNGNDSTAVINDIDKPFLTLAAAVTALSESYPGEATTLKIKSDLTDDLPNSTPGIDICLTAGLTIKSNLGVHSITGNIGFGTSPNAVLTISKLSISTLTKTQNSFNPAGTSAGQITGDADTVIGLLDIRGIAGNDGTPGNPGGTVNGNVGSTGNDGDPPENGGTGENVTSNGTGAGSPNPGSFAWDLGLIGTGTVTMILGSGGDGGNSANGGDGGTATGGSGGPGGNSTAIALQDGGNGGSGGDATANGSDGGAASTGGDGAHVQNIGTWIITGSSLTGGIGKPHGAGGAAGTAIGGNGGVGGVGALGGATGATGSTGATTAVAGSPGPGSATNGTDGYIF